MGTLLVYSAALLLVGAIAADPSAAVSSVSSTTAPAAIKLSSTEDASGVVNPKSKRGVVETGTNAWVHNGGFQSKSTNPNTKSATVNQNSEYRNPQHSSSSSSSAYTPAYNNANPGYQPASSYSNVNSASSDESDTNAGQPYGPTGPSYGSTGQGYVSSAQNYGSADLGQSTGFAGFYTPQSQSSGSYNSPNFGSLQAVQPVTSSAQSQNSQGGEIRNGAALNTPYYASFASAVSPVKIFTDKLPTGQYRASLVQVPQGQSDSSKMPPRYAPDHQSASYIIPNSGSYSYQPLASVNQESLFSAQGVPVFAATSQIHRNTLKADLPGQNNANYGQMYAPYYQSASNYVPNIRGNGFGPTTVDFNGKKVPLPVIQLQSAEDFPGFAQSINTQPLILGASSPIQGQTEFGFLADFAKSFTPQVGNISPFLSTQQSNQPQVLPVRSANGSPQFPQYKGASINTSPIYNQGKPAPSYQPLNAQPQLHFTAKPASPPSISAPVSTSSVIHYPPLKSRPVAEIRDDVEVINKKKKPSPPPPDFGDDDLDEGYKAIEREYGRQQDDEDESPHRGKYFKESDAESDFKPSKGFPFKSYDEQFSKYSKQSSDEDSEDDKPSSAYRHSSSSSAEDDDYDGHSSTHHANYRSPKARPSRYEDSAEESRSHERQDEAEAEEDEEHDKTPSPYKAYGKDFEQEFEESYRRELPKTKYVHIKEVPEIDEAGYTGSDSPQKSSKSRGTSGYHQRHDEDPEESQSYSSHTPHNYRNDAKTRDGDGYRSNYRPQGKGHFPKVVHEESFGYRMPDAKSYSKYKKTPTGDSYSSVKKTPKMDSYLQASRSSYKSPKKDGDSFENGDSYSYSKGSSWKSDKKSPETSDYHGGASAVVKTLALPESQFGFHAPANSRATFFITHDGKIERDLTGI